MRFLKNYISLNIEESIFENNKAIYFSNVISFSGWYLRINKCLFLSNTPYGQFNLISETQGRSGSIEVLDGNAFIGNSYFFNNSKSKGGAMTFLDNSQFINKTIFISKCIFENNVANIGGSLFFSISCEMQIAIKNCIFIYNWASLCNIK